MDDDRPDADEVEQNHILGKTLFQAFIDLRRASIFNDKGLAVKVADVRQRFNEYVRLLE
jgi:hypothetical protein